MKSIVKAVTWRIVAATTTMATVYAMTGDIGAHDRAYDRWWPASETVETA